MPSFCVASHVAALRPHDLSSRARIRPIARAPRNRDTRRRSAPAVKFGTAAAAGSRPSRVPDRRPRPSHDDLIRVDDEASDVRRLRGNCYGCGVALQTERADVSGYVDPDEYETKRVHKQLFGMMLCARCGDLSNGAMVNAVAGQGGARMSQGLITPSQLREQLTHIRDKKVLVVKVVDVTDFHGCFLNRVRDVVGANPILLVLTKCDLLPNGTESARLKEWARREVETRRRLTLAGIECVSGRKGDGVENAVTAMFAERKGRDVYVIGSANVGKSTFIRAALKSMRELGNFGVPAKRLPTASAMPGTTLGIIPLRAFEGRGVLYDTPGVFLHHRMNSILAGEDIKRFRLGGSLVRYVPRPRCEDDASDRTDFAGLTLLWGPLIRVDVLLATPNAGLVFYGPKGMRVTVVETSKLPDPMLAQAAADRERDSRRAAMAERATTKGAGVDDADADADPDPGRRVRPEEDERLGKGAGGGLASSAASGAASAVEAVAEWRAESASSPAMTTPYSNSDFSDLSVFSGRESPASSEAEPVDGSSATGDGRFVFCERLVKELEVNSPEGSTGARGGVVDLSVSGMGGWIRVVRESRVGACEMTMRVWGPRGLEVFAREPMPTGL